MWTALRDRFFDYILDHPLFHYQGLSSGVKNLHAIVLDEAQQKYVEKYYEKVASVHMLPLGATRAVYEGTKSRSAGFYFRERMTDRTRFIRL